MGHRNTQRRRQQAGPNGLSGSHALKASLATVAQVTLLIGSLGFCLVQAWGWASTSPTFAVDEILVRGVNRLGEDEVRRATGVLPGTNLLALERSAVEAAVEKLGWVESSRMRRVSPHQISIEVVERTPHALLLAGELYLVDGHGVVFKRWQSKESIDLPVVSGIERTEFSSPNADANSRVMQALEILRLAASQPELSAVGEIRANADGWVLTFANGVLAHLPSEGVEEQLRRLARLNAILAARGQRASVVRLDNRVRPSRISLQLGPAPVAVHVSSPSQDTNFQN